MIIVLMYATAHDMILTAHDMILTGNKVLFSLAYDEHRRDFVSSSFR